MGCQSLLTRNPARTFLPGFDKVDRINGTCKMPAGYCTNCLCVCVLALANCFCDKQETSELILGLGNENDNLRTQ